MGYGERLKSSRCGQKGPVYYGRRLGSCLETRYSITGLRGAERDGRAIFSSPVSTRERPGSALYRGRNRAKTKRPSSFLLLLLRPIRTDGHQMDGIRDGGKVRYIEFMPLINEKEGRRISKFFPSARTNGRNATIWISRDACYTPVQFRGRVVKSLGGGGGEAVLYLLKQARLGTRFGNGAEGRLMLINLKRGEEIKQSVCPDTCIRT